MARKFTRDAGLYCHDIEWLIHCADSVLGESGTLGAMLAIVELGGPAAGGMPETWRYSSEQLVAVRRARRLQLIWRNVPLASRGLLRAHYESRAIWPPGVQGELGQFAGVALAMGTTRAAAKLCRDCAGGDRKAVRRARDAAERLVREAHAAWYAAEGHQFDAWVEPDRYAAAYEGAAPHTPQLAWDRAERDETPDTVDELEANSCAS